jgi:hypothetical protein
LDCDAAEDIGTVVETDDCCEQDANAPNPSTIDTCSNCFVFMWGQPNQHGQITLIVNKI